jgi:hypothetical protein
MEIECDKQMLAATGLEPQDLWYKKLESHT